MIGARRGYRVKLMMPANASAERKKLLAAYGAEFVLTDPAQGSDGAYFETQKLFKEKPGEYLRLTASVLPREFIFENVTLDLDDEQIDELLLALRQRMIEARTAPALLASPDADGVGNEPEPRH